MLTLDELKAMEPGRIIGSGETVDSLAGINMSNTGQRLRWVAVRGEIHDWCIYIGPAYQSVGHIMREGDKVCAKDNIQKLVPCTSEAFAMYRY